MLDKKISWLFFDVGTTLVDETQAYNHRMLDNDIYPAKKLGMHTIWVKQGSAVYQKPENADYEADYTVDKLDKLKEII